VVRGQHGRRLRGEGEGFVYAEVKADLADGVVDVAVEAGGVVDKEGVSLDDPGNGGRGQADGAEYTSELVDISVGAGGFDQAAGEDTNEGNFFSKALGGSAVDTVEVLFLRWRELKPCLRALVLSSLAPGRRGEVFI